MVSRRVWRLFALVAAALLVILGRLAWLQVLSPDAGLAEQAHQRQYYEVAIQPFRGDIRAGNGGPLATDHLAFDIAVPYARFSLHKPNWLGRMFRAAERLKMDISEAARSFETAPPRWAFDIARVASISVEEIMGRRRAVSADLARMRESVLRRNPALRARRLFRIKEETEPQVILSNAPLEVASRILARPEAFPDVLVVPARRRRYPMGRLACHVVGRL